MSAVNDVLVTLVIGSDAYVVRFSRVPTIGEHVFYKGQDYVVREVTHTPNSARAAEISVAIEI